VIIACSPIRLTLGGVTTDVPAYYRDHGGFLVAAAIDKYVYVAVTRPFEPGIYIHGRDAERFDTVDAVTNPIIREALRRFDTGRPQIEITTFSDVPPGTGLGSSGSFTTALLRALHTLHRTTVNPSELAEQACYIEMQVLGEPIGKQDQYMAALGGLTCLTFAKDGSVSAEPLRVEDETRVALEESILLFFTGGRRSASDILREQVLRLERRERTMVDAIHFEMENAAESRAALEKGDLAHYGRLLSAHWDRKRKRTSVISTPEIDRLYEVGLSNGALGGKLVGAGGAGFLMFCANDRTRLRRAMREEGLGEMRFRFDNEGTRVLSTRESSGSGR
jgi:D-glycero-alpha-D-manno-heptose-7-phosphate kinase